MTLNTWWLFVMMTFVVSATPGPNMLLVMSSSARFGFRAAMAAMAGCMTALLAMMSISAAGLGALLQAFPAVFDALRLLGAAYLAYLGIMIWRAPIEDSTDTIGISSSPLEPSKSPSTLYRQGLLVAASNPKAILFAAAFLPQFIDAEAPQLPQFMILLATFASIEISWYVVYAASGNRLANGLRKANVAKWFNRITGGAFVGFAIAMSGIRD